MDSVKICNLALMTIGIPTITSFDDSNNNARLCKNFFPVLRDRCLRDHTWSFATASHDLQIISETSFDPDYEYVCSLPGDLIRIINLIGSHPYRKLGNKILCNAHPATLVYIRRVEDASLFDDTFVEALQYLLAVELGMANTRDANLINFYRQEYEKKLAVARSIDSQENVHAMQNSARRSSWIAARRGGPLPYSGKTEWTEGTEGRQP